MSIKIALAGNPNSGKTTLFNALTGANQFVGNWPGVTVEKKEAAQTGIKHTYRSVIHNCDHSLSLCCKAIIRNNSNYFTTKHL